MKQVLKNAIDDLVQNLYTELEISKGEAEEELADALKDMGVQGAIFEYLDQE